MQKETVRKNHPFQLSSMEPIPDFILRLAPDGTPLDCGIACSQDLFDKKVDEVLPEEVAGILIDRIKDALANGNISRFEYELLFEDSRRKFEGRAIANTSENIILVIREVAKTETNNNIQGRQNGHKSSLKQEVTAASYIASLDKASSLVYVSPHIENLVGYSQNQLLADRNLW